MAKLSLNLVLASVFKVINLSENEEANSINKRIPITINMLENNSKSERLFLKRNNDKNALSIENFAPEKRIIEREVGPAALVHFLSASVRC